MAPLFCCNSIAGYKNRRLNHEDKFDAFMTWAKSCNAPDEATTLSLNPAYAIQLVRQVNFGPLESKRYFVPIDAQSGAFIEVQEADLIAANMQKLNTFKNFKCTLHNRFFEVNVYQKDPVNKHHWRADLARPASTIDL